MIVYRGYNKDYPNFGVRPNQNHIWTTSDIDYALEYAKIFDNGGLVEFEINDELINMADEYDCEELFDDWDEFGGIIDADNDMCQTLLDMGYNCVYLDNGGIDCYLILDKNLIKSSKDLSLNVDDISINEVLNLAGIKSDKIDESYLKTEDNEILYYTISETNFLNIVKNKFNKEPVRVFYDFNTRMYVFANAYETTHINMLQDMIKYNKKYSYITYDFDDEYYIPGYDCWNNRYLIYEYLNPNCAMFQIIWDTNIHYYDTNDGYTNGYWAEFKNFYVICRGEELRKMQKIPLFYNTHFNSEKYDSIKRLNKKGEI